jgi:hypothetical protein
MSMTDDEIAAAEAQTVQTPTARAREAAQVATQVPEQARAATPRVISSDAVTEVLPAASTAAVTEVLPSASAEPVGAPAPIPAPAQVPASSQNPGPPENPAPRIVVSPQIPAPTLALDDALPMSMPVHTDPEPQNSSTPRTIDWKQSIPYDQTGVLIRPAGWTDDQIETALIDVMALRRLRKHAGAAAEEDASARPRWRRLVSWLVRLPNARHAVLAAVLTLQAALSLRNTNTAFMDEALYLYSGHLELGHLVQGAPLYDDFSTYLSGAPVLYPVLGALADQIGGVFAARLLSLLFMLGATVLVYLIARRIFGVRAALLAAGLFSTTESVAFVGGLATYDAPAVFLLALAGWIVVRFARSPWPFYLLAVIPLALAVGTKYAALLFVPTVLALACFGALTTHGRWWSLVRSVSLGLVFGALVYGLVRVAGADYWTGISSTTTARPSGTTSTGHILNEVAQWGGLMFALAAVGGVLYVWRPRFAYDAADQPGRAGRLGLVIVLLGTALLAPADQLHLHTDVSLYKHVGFGLLFAAPLAGYGLQRLIGAHYQRIQFGIAVWVIALALSVSQTTNLFHAWPSSTKLVATIRHYSRPHGEYLVENSAPVIYSLRDDVNAEPYQIISTFSFQFTDLEGRSYTGAAAYTAAIRDDFFNVVAFDYSATAGVDSQILTALKANHDYYLTTTITQQTSQGYDTYFVWIKWEPGQK